MVGPGALGMAGCKGAGDEEGSTATRGDGVSEAGGLKAGGWAGEEDGVEVEMGGEVIGEGAERCCSESTGWPLPGMVL